MSGRFHNSNIYAFDDQGQEHLLSEFYSYSDGCGYYKNVIAINGQEYRVEDYVGDDDEPTIYGEKLPYLQLEDMQSYFTANPTSEMQDALRIAKINTPLVSFLYVGVDSVLCGPTDAFCMLAKKDSVSEYTHDLCKERMGDDVERVMKNLLEKYEPMCR